MKVAPVSADLLLKLALGAALIAALVYVARRVSSAASDAAGQAYSAVAETVSTTLNPASDQNFVYTGVNALGHAVATEDPAGPGRNADGSWTLGGWIYDVTH
ncbi:MAG: hypothetical protein V4609_17525 [Pseudomonadota bacterium]